MIPCRDRPICNHGTCTRIVDSLIEKHRDVKIENLNNEFKAAVIKKVKALPEAEYNTTVEFQRQLSAPVSAC